MYCMWLRMIWLHLAALRFMLCILPQTGLVFEKEFQTSEVMADNIFGLLSGHSAQANSSLSKQNILFQLSSTGFPYVLLKYCAQFFPSIVTSYTLLIFPRMFVTAHSLLVDMLIYRTTLQCCNNPETAHHACIIFASSCISWIFCTRTFLATYQLIFLSTILYICSHEKYSHSLNFLLSCIATVAVFMDTSYAVAICMPVLLWVFKCKGTESVFQSFVSLVPGVITTVACLFIVDCVYTAPDKFQELFDIQLSIASFKKWATDLPWASFSHWFFKAENHRSLFNLHAQHIIALSMSPLFAFLCLTKLLKLPAACVDHAKNTLAMMGLIAIVGPLYSLLFSSGNDLFLLPLIVPLTILTSAQIHHVKCTKVGSILWVTFNVVLFLIFGMINEGGMIPCMDYMHSMVSVHDQLLSSSNTNTELHILFYHTPTPPVHLMNLHKSKLSPTGHISLHIHIINEQELKHVDDTLGTILQPHNTLLYLVSPASILCDTQQLLQNKYHMELYYEVHPHLTFYNPAWRTGNGCDNGDSRILKFLQDMTLNIHRVHSISDVQHTLQLKSFKE